MLYIYSYNPHSRGARELARAIGIRRVRHEGSRVNLGPRDVLINWGASRLPPHVAGAGHIINPPDRVGRASNKLQFLQQAQESVRTVPWTTDPAVARSWNAKVVARHTLTGHSGEGIEIVEPGGVDIPAALLYTRYIGKDSEWRIHVYEGQMIDFTRKIRDPNFQGTVDWNVRNHAGGFIYARNSGQPNADVVRQAEAAIEAVGLDFGAVDVLVSRRDGLAYVLEINTAPGLVGTTVQRYAEAFIP